MKINIYMFAVVLLLIGLALHSCWDEEVTTKTELIGNYTPLETTVFTDVMRAPGVVYYYSLGEYQELKGD